MKFWTICRSCSGRGELNPNSKYARIPANMTGEIKDYSVSVCKDCRGTGLRWKSTLIFHGKDCQCTDCARLG